ncbi:MAG: universal stress protein [Flavobacteriaceae bacterium]
MKKNNYKILVLSDLKEDSKNTLKSAVSIAKITHADIHLFHVKRASDIVGKENQLSAMRTINSEYKTLNKDIQNLAAPFSKEYGKSIQTKFSFGNVKSEIGKYIKELQPDIIVLGKKKSNSFNFMGDRVAEFVLKLHPGVMMIASNENAIEPNQEIALGVLNDLKPSSSLAFIDDLIGDSKKPITSFKIAQNSDVAKEKAPAPQRKTIEYVFEKNDNSLKNISNYVLKNKINLLCVNRGQENQENNTGIREVIEKLNVSLLVSANQNYAL